MPLRKSTKYKDNDDPFPQNEGFLNEDQITFVNYSNNYCVGIIDIINSTSNTSDMMESKKIKQYYSVFLNTMTSIIKHHNGKVIKNSGDNLLYYFPRTMYQDNYIDFQDAIECGLSMIDAKDQVDLLLNLNGLPSIDYRISASYGRVELAVAANSHSIDIFGTPVNICSKINHMASPNEMIIHNDLFQIINKMSYCKDYVFEQINRTDGINDYADTNNIYLYSAYSVHRFGDINKQKEIENKILKKRSEYNLLKQQKNNSSFNILVIDDDKDILFAFTSIIQSQGYNVTPFSDSYEALENFSTSNPYLYDLIIMDMRMPRINGIKLYSKFKIMNPEIKIVFVSALDAIDEMLSLFPEIKDSHILRKPIDPQQLLNKINIEIRN